MRRARLAAGALTVALALLALTAAYRARERHTDRDPATSPPIVSSAAPSPETGEAMDARGSAYGRVTTVEGAIYEGRLRWGGDQEAHWGDTFNGTKDENPWASQVPLGRLPNKRRAIEIFGVEIAQLDGAIDLRRPFMARLGDIARIEARGGDVRVTLKSGTAIDLDRFSASDFDDGVRVWDARRGVVDLDSLWIRTIELLPTPSLGSVPEQLHGTVRTPQGDFTGFLQWDREKCVGSDEFTGRTADGETSLRFDSIGSVARVGDGARVALRDGREIVFTGGRMVGGGNRGIYVEDRRYGRVLIPKEAFERVDFSPGGSGPAYGDFPPGRSLTGSVTSRDGRRLAGRLVFDLDESETTETLDAPSQGVDYSIPFGLIAAIVPGGSEERGARLARVVLRSGEELQLERAGDLGEGNAGVLIFVDGLESPEYLAWAEVERIDLDHSPGMSPAGRSALVFLAEAYSAGPEPGGVEAAPRLFTAPDDVCGTAPEVAALRASGPQSARVGAALSLGRFRVEARDAGGRLVSRVPLAIELDEKTSPPFERLRFQETGELWFSAAGVSELRFRTICQTLEVGARLTVDVRK